MTETNKLVKLVYLVVFLEDLAEAGEVERLVVLK